ncbi:MAG: DUF433 domain-containing protein [Desulfobacterales bacterium]|nr:DUF433 domain-containing protein [Desulfobacterales bacterium]
MQLEDYFDFHSKNDIRIKGHRIGIESVLYEYIHRARTPEEIAEHFPTLSLEQIYASVLYYLHNKAQIHTYITEWLEHTDRMLAEQEQNPTPAILRLRKIKAEREAAKYQKAETA